jgi:hypothetical protein
MERPIVMKRRLLAESIRIKFAPRSQSLEKIEDISFKLTSNLNGGFWHSRIASEAHDQFLPFSGNLDKTFFKKKDKVIGYNDLCCKQKFAFSRSGKEVIKRKVVQFKKG